jgi:hypothetical protein
VTKKPKSKHRDLIVPGGDGIMPLFDAVHWIASKGHSKDPTARWDSAASELIVALVGNRLAAIGTRRGHSTPEDIPAYDWQGVVTNRLKREPYLSLIGPASEHDSDEGEFQDELYLMREILEPMWQRLAVKQADVRKLWPFHLTQTDAPPELTKYGHRPGQKWRAGDEPIFHQMSEAMEKEDTRHAAANKFAKDAWGTGTEESRAKRLRDGYLHWVSSKKRD